MRIGPGGFRDLHNRFHRKNRRGIESPAKLIQYRKRIVLVRKTEPRYLLVDWLELGKLWRCAFNRDSAPDERVFKASGEARPDRIEFILWSEFELGIEFRSEPDLTQSLERVFARLIIRINPLLIPSSCRVSRIILQRLGRIRYIWRFRQRRTLARWIGNGYFVKECSRHALEHSHRFTVVRADKSQPTSAESTEQGPLLQHNP